MATIYNSDLSKELVDGAKIQVSSDKIPNQLGQTVVPVMEVNPKMLRICNVAKHSVQLTTGSLTVFTTSAYNDFYLNSAYVEFIKDVTCDIATGSISFATTINGVATRLLDFPVITATAQPLVGAAISFPVPLKIDRGAAITLSGTFTAGVLVRSCGITGFTVDNINA